MCCLSILDHLLILVYNEAASDDKQAYDAILPADPMIRIATSFISQLLCHTAVVPACDAQLAQFLGGSSELPSISDTLNSDSLENQVSEGCKLRDTRWRMWKLQRDAVNVLIKCTQSPVHPHVSSTPVFIIAGALQVNLCDHSLGFHETPIHYAFSRHDMFGRPPLYRFPPRFFTLHLQGTLR
jgi:hypothetical protein